MTSPVRRPGNRDDTHSGKPTLLDGNATCVDMTTESQKPAPHSAVGSSTPAHESPGPYLTHPDLNGVPCQGDNIPASDTSTRHETIPESPRGSPGNLTLDSPEGQDLAIVGTTKPGAVASGASLTRTATSSSQSASDPSTSAHTSQPVILAPLEMAEVSNNSGDVPLSAAPSRCSIPGTRDASPERQLSPETSQVQGLAMTGCESSDVEAQAHAATSGLSSEIQEAPSPSQTLITRRRSRRQAALRSIRYDDDSDSDLDGDSQGSEDLDHTNLPRHKGFCTSGSAVEERSLEGETSDGDEQCPRKRRRLSESSTGLVRHATTSVKGRASLRSTTQSIKWGNHSRASGILSPALSQATSIEAEVGAVLARFEEWPLENVSLKRITENGRATFQLQFDWTPCADRGCVDSPSTQTVHRAKRASASRTHYTTEEDDLLLELKERERLAWPEIHRRFTKTYPARSVQSLQVHYSTKLKSRESS
ncbi:hypothetical protein B0T10DRAFT_137140 [Thelonectria olida]|uniref:Myb-like domain-containing protein n=1 Tax=Thelonectria olida TaxID=1576542 RepID=A0A9P8VX69_9HYPO|nr:hypothetical protein B0T10DRAFT_137140 [Thelonectria olida]